VERITPTQSATQHQVVTMIRVRCQNKITEVQLTPMTISNIATAGGGKGEGVGGAGIAVVDCCFRKFGEKHFIHQNSTPENQQFVPDCSTS